MTVTVQSSNDRPAPVSAPASRLVFAGICALAAFAPLAFGSVETWARAVILALSLLLCLVWLGEGIVRGRLRLRPTPLYAPLAAFFIWAGVQLLVNRTLYPHASREELVWSAAAALVWLLVLNALNPPEVRRLALFFVIFGFGLALFAIFQGLATRGDTIYLFRELSHGPTAYGPFVNKNHYAGYMVLLTPLPLALVLYGGVRPEQRGLLWFMALVMMLSVVLSRSRTGAAVVVLQAAALWCLARVRQQRLSRAVLAILLPALVVAGAGWLGGRPVAERFQTLLRFPQETSLSVRLQVDRDMLEMVRQHPLWGTGLATFGAVYPLHKSFEDNLLWDHGHNDLLELVVEMGIPGAAFLLLFLGGLVALWKKARGAPDSGTVPENFPRAVIAAVLTGCAGLLLHGLLDFPFRIPAIALTFSALYALGLALAMSRAPAPKG